MRTFARGFPARRITWWRGLGRIKRYSLVAVVILAAIAIPLGVLVWSGVSAALDARQAYRDLQAELSHLTPIDLVQVNVYQSLEGDFKEAEESSARARSRLAFLRAFQWLPVVGGRIKEARLLLEIGFHQGRAGRILASAYGGAISLPLEEMPSDLAADNVSRVLREAAPQLAKAQEDLRRVRELREKLGTGAEGARYGVLVDRYLPAIQTVAYLSLTNPEVIGHTYSLSRELSSLQELAADPLDVIANPEEAGEALDNIAQLALALESDFEVVRLATKASETDGTSELAEVRDVLDTLGPGVTLLRHVTAGTSSLVTLAGAIDSEGFLSREFGVKAGLALDEAQEELTLAREQVTSLQRLLSLQGIDAETFLPSAVLGGDSEASTSSTERVELMLDETLSATRFLHSFLGFEEPRTYLLLGQNQNEIRATGGFIGIAVKATLDRGELTELVFQDSTKVDSGPYTDNPVPPEGLYWYLWMGRLLFRDANWSPHFPASAAKVAEIYRGAQGVQVDGVVTATKLMALDLVELFGDVTVPELDEVLTRKSADDYTEGRIPYECLPRHVSTRGKRCFGEDMFFALQERLTAGVPSPVRRSLVGLFKDHLDLKNVLIHVFPPTDDTFLWERGWNGAMSFVDHDYLMVVDSSLPGHTAAVVHRSWEYSVSLNPDQPIEAKLRLRYDNREQANDKICHQVLPSLGPCYWNYFRVYVSPKASSIEMPSVPLHEGSLKLIWGYPDADSSSVVPNADSGPARLTELGGYITVQPGSLTTVPIQYRLPEILRPTAPDVYEYRLLLQKQPAMDRDRVSIAVELPDDAELLGTSPEYNSIRGRWLLFDFTLLKDTTVAVSFRMKQPG